MTLSECEMDLVDEVAKEVYVRRTFNLKDASSAELEVIATSCYSKAEAFLNARRKFLERI